MKKEENDFKMFAFMSTLGVVAFFAAIVGIIVENKESKQNETEIKEKAQSEIPWFVKSIKQEKNIKFLLLENRQTKETKLFIYHIDTQEPIELK